MKPLSLSATARGMRKMLVYKFPGRPGEKQAKQPMTTDRNLARGKQINNDCLWSRRNAPRLHNAYRAAAERPENVGSRLTTRLVMGH